jgi:putative FmdB family regulatory protein
MPTYEYICEKCNHEFELFQPITAEPLTVCPKEHCQGARWGKGRVKRKIGGGGGLIFKGSGFYITDYRSDSYKASAKKDSESSKAAPASSDSKPASTTPAPAADKGAKASPKSSTT